MKAPVTYHPGWIPNPDEVFAELAALDWERREGAPRSEYYINDFPEPYAYGRGVGRRIYHPRPKSPAVAVMQDRLFALTGDVFDVCFLNRYLDGKDQLGWHADDSPEMDDARPIASVSLGAEREIWFRPKRDFHDPFPDAQVRAMSEVEKLRLGHGSLCLMAPGMQDAWQHRIPKADRPCGERISLTFRGYVVKP